MADQIGPMPVLTLSNGAQVMFEAIDPTDGTPVSGVEITAAMISGIDLTVPDESESPPVANTAIFLPGPAFS
jgi:hypothetical protein